MIYAPRGFVFPSMLAEPSDLMQEFYEAAKIAGRTTQWNWGEGSMGSPSTTVVTRQYDNSGWTIQSPPAVSTATNAWQVPYNSGLQEVGGGPNGVTFAREWESAYPELVLAIFHFQYLREGMDTGEICEDFLYRLMMRMRFDGCDAPGSGPFAIPKYGNPRAMGYAGRSLVSSITAVQFLGAGAHRVGPVAGLAPAHLNKKFKRGVTHTKLDDNTAGYAPGDDDMAVISGGRMTLVRFPQAKELR